ncbi:MAG TPA: EVE domain-containing protein [Gammaproteobacteria bacterium]|nr:EVE domain-containing protein [Gammaproteobacteria bacterium]
MNYWLMKSEPSTFGIEDLANAPRKSTTWNGIRNYQVRNMLRDQMHKGDLAFFYHSSCAAPGIAGIMKVSCAAYPDSTAFEPENPLFDPRSTPTKPRWYAVDMMLVERFKQPITLTELRRHAALDAMLILRRGNRLSITPVSAKQWFHILKLITVT